MEDLHGKSGSLFLVIPDSVHRESILPPSCPTCVIGHPSGPHVGWIPADDLREKRRWCIRLRPQPQCYRTLLVNWYFSFYKSFYNLVGWRTPTDDCFWHPKSRSQI